MLLIFDWDGTLCDSAARIVSCMQSAANQTAQEVLTPEQIRNVIGLGLPESMLRLYPKLSDVERDSLKAVYIEHFLAADQIPSPLFKGVEEGLKQLKAAGFLLAVATGKSRRGLDRVLDYHGFADLFVASRCANETRSKPDPLMLSQLLEVCDFAPNQALMVGDTEYDMAMAKTLLMPRLGVSYGVHSTERLLAFEPLACLEDFEQVTPWIENYYSSILS